MVKVEIKRVNQKIDEILIYGHANYAEHGQDLVCAGVSSIGIGTLNALDQLCENMCELSIQEAYIRIKVKQRNHVVDNILSTIYIQLKTMQESYPLYISIQD